MKKCSQKHGKTGNTLPNTKPHLSGLSGLDKDPLLVIDDTPPKLLGFWRVISLCKAPLWQKAQTERLLRTNDSIYEKIGD
jgi:hypothetical protein